MGLLSTFELSYCLSPSVVNTQEKKDFGANCNGTTGKIEGQTYATHTRREPYPF